MLERLIQNLVGNALEYTVDNGWVLVRVAGPGTVIFSNSGPLVPPDRVPRLFEPFQRLSATRLSHTAGVGLGLTIVRSIVADHGGTVTASAHPEGGLTVRIDLPPTRGDRAVHPPNDRGLGSSVCSTAAGGYRPGMHTRTIGQTTVSAIGLGGMPLSIEGRPDDRAAAIATIHASLDAGVRLIDTADAYHLAGHVDDEEVGHNESLIAEALRSWSGDTDDVLVATKGGHTRSLPDSWEQDGSPEHLRAACEASLRRLGVDAIGLYQYHRPDPKVPYEDSVGTLRDLLDEGKIRQAGISNANPEQIRQAQDILGGRLASVQNQYSPAFLSSRPELELCAELGIAFLPWSPLGGISKASDLGSTYAVFQQVADELDASPQQVTLAWMLATSPVVVPIPGSSRPETARSSAAATDLELSADQQSRLDLATGV